MPSFHCKTRTRLTVCGFLLVINGNPFFWGNSYFAPGFPAAIPAGAIPALLAGGRQTCVKVCFLSSSAAFAEICALARAMTPGSWSLGMTMTRPSVS